MNRHDSDFPEMDTFNSRFSDQIALPGIGINGQEKLKNSRVLCVGAGGLGSSAAVYLAAAGVGVLGVIDDDRVERSNLQRQILHSEDRIGQLKVISASSMLSALNSAVEIKQYPFQLDEENARQIMDQYDIVIDGSDNYPSRYLISDVCYELDRPHVYGAVHQFQGQVAVFWPNRSKENPCYRCLYPDNGEAPMGDCNTQGVLGIVPGLVGTLQANEAIKLILGIGQALTQELLIYDALSQRFKKTRVPIEPDCHS